MEFNLQSVTEENPVLSAALIHIFAWSKTNDLSYYDVYELLNNVPNLPKLSASDFPPPYEEGLFVFQRTIHRFNDQMLWTDNTRTRVLDGLRPVECNENLTVVKKEGEMGDFVFKRMLFHCPEGFGDMRGVVHYRTFPGYDQGSGSNGGGRDGQGDNVKSGLGYVVGKQWFPLDNKKNLGKGGRYYSVGSLPFQVNKMEILGNSMYQFASMTDYAVHGHYYRMYPSEFYGQYGSLVRSGGMSYDSRKDEREIVAVDNRSKRWGRSNYYFYRNDSIDGLKNHREDFPIEYEDALSFIIKSYSEDNVHKSITEAFSVPVDTIQINTANLIPQLDQTTEESDVTETKTCAVPDKEEFSIEYRDALSVITKSDSEDDVHTKLDAASKKAQQKAGGCPVVLLVERNSKTCIFDDCSTDEVRQETILERKAIQRSGKQEEDEQEEAVTSDSESKASDPKGNKKVDASYQKAQQIPGGCLLFSVNSIPLDFGYWEPD